MDVVLAVVGLVCAAIPTVLFVRNLSAYVPPRRGRAILPGMSVLIPARNEENNIGAAVASALANEGLPIEVIVLDDESTDGTAQVLDAIARRDSRLKVISGTELPQGWCGKQRACAELGRHATFPLLCFLDADVVLRPDALARMADFMETREVDLASGVPRQETVTVLERLLIPLIQFVLLAFLPMRRMRQSLHPSYAAGCGQLFVARAESYRKVGGHAAIRSTLHDGLNLPRAFRKARMRTDLFDVTAIATCRMYRSNAEVWTGLSKNAAEGLGSATLIVPMTLILFLGQVAPLIVMFATEGFAQVMAALAMLIAYVPRVLAVRRFRQSVLGALLHPVAIVLLLAIQWQARIAETFGRSVEWKGRAYRAAGPS